MTSARAPYPTELYGGCPCHSCCAERGEAWKMTLCPECGDKRCAGAVHHGRHSG